MYDGRERKTDKTLYGVNDAKAIEWWVQVNLAATQKKDLVRALKQDRDGARAVMEKYPSYFQERMNALLQ